uniref:Transmembrane 9 superfamily member n=1 Tax=Phallusia mammillata TaxID=59560 RepID=A0A6F9DU98_9ASCI|nr:transmembrane 9 superfamily member 2-like [Phallusia mammillata]
MFRHILLLVLMLAFSCQAFYLPGLPPQDYCRSGTNKTCLTAIQVFVNRLTSSLGLFSYDYSAFDFCGNESKPINQNLGQELFGERIKTSPYKFSFDTNNLCTEVCRRSYNSSDERLEFLKQGILYSYTHWWIIDNMPLSWCYETIDSTEFCTPNFPIGCYVNKAGTAEGACGINEAFNKADTFYLFNHVDIVIYFRPSLHDKGISRLVKATLAPKSYSENYCSGPPLAIPSKSEGMLNIPYTYSVYFQPEYNLEWATRWSYIFNSTQYTNVLWFSFLNSGIVNLFLLLSFALLYFRRIKSRIAASKQMKVVPVESPWESLRCDVFRVPPKPKMFSVFVGVGFQIFWTTIITLCSGALGFLSPANRGALGTTIVTLFVSFGSLAGYKSARLYKTFEREDWKSNAVLTSLSISGFIFMIFFAVNLIYWNHGSSAAVSAWIFAEVVLIWFGGMLPLTILGTYLGQRKAKFHHPGFVNSECREIPQNSCLKKPIISIILGGLLPFGTIFIPFFFILNSIWFHQYYTCFGYALLALVNLSISCGLVTILLCYLHLTAEDYRWWWRSFLTAGFTAVYLFIYATHFYIKHVEAKTFATFIAYFGVTTIMTTLLFLFCGEQPFIFYFFYRNI